MADAINLRTELLYTAPGAFALIFAGPAFYLSELDPIVRKQLGSEKQQLKHWSTMYNLGLKTMPAVVLLGVSSAVAAYLKSKEKYWIYGAIALFSIFPYTFLGIMPTNNKLNAILEEAQAKAKRSTKRKKSFAPKMSGEESEPEKEEDRKAREQLDEEKADEATAGMRSWVRLHRVRGLLALGAAGLFLVARALTKK